MDLENKIKSWVKDQLVTMPRGAKKKLADYLKITPYPINALVEPGGWQRTPLNAGGRVFEDSRIFW